MLSCFAEPQDFLGFLLEVLIYQYLVDTVFSLDYHDY